MLKETWSHEDVARLKASRPSRSELNAKFDAVRRTLESCVAFLATFQTPKPERRGQAEHVYTIICETCTIGFEILDFYPAYGLDPEASLHLQDRWSLLHKCMVAEKCLQRGFGYVTRSDLASHCLAEKLANYMCSGPGAGLQFARIRLVEKLTQHVAADAADDYNKALYILYSALAKEAKRYQAQMDRSKETVYLHHLGFRNRRTKSYLAEALELEALLDQTSKKTRKSKRRSLALDLVDDVSKEEEMTCYCHQPFLDCVMEHFQQLIDIPAMNRVMKYKILGAGFNDAKKYHVVGSQQKRCDSSCSVTALLWMAMFFWKSFGASSVAQDLYNRALVLLADMPASTITSWHKRAAADIKGIVTIRSVGEQAARKREKHAEAIEEIAAKHATLPMGEFIEWIAGQYAPNLVPDMLIDDCEYLKLYKADKRSSQTWPDTFRIVISALKVFDVYYYVTPKPFPAVINHEKTVFIFQAITKALLSYFDWMTGDFTRKLAHSSEPLRSSQVIIPGARTSQVFNANGAVIKVHEDVEGEGDSKAQQTWTYVDILTTAGGPSIKRFAPSQLQDQCPCALENGDFKDSRRFESFRRISTDQVEYHPLRNLDSIDLRKWEKQRDEEWKHWEQQTFAPQSSAGMSFGGPSWTEMDAVDESWLSQETSNWGIAADCGCDDDNGKGGGDSADQRGRRIDKGKAKARFVRPLYDDFERSRRSTHPAPSSQSGSGAGLQRSNSRQNRAKSLESSSHAPDSGDAISISEITSEYTTLSISSKLVPVPTLTPVAVKEPKEAKESTGGHVHNLFKKRSALKRASSATPPVLNTPKDAGSLTASSSHSKTSSEDESRDLVLKHVLSNNSSNAGSHHGSVGGGGGRGSGDADSIPRSESAASVTHSLKKLSSFKTPTKIGGKLSGFAQKIRRKPSLSVVKS